MAESVRERLERRNEERLASLEKKKAEKETKTQPKESKDFFLENFSKEKSELDAMLGESEKFTGDKVALTTHFDAMSEKCQRLQKFLADSTMFLPSYDVKLSQTVINTLQQSINEARDQFLPKKKFAFKIRKKQAEGEVDGSKKNTDAIDDKKAYQVDGTATLTAIESKGFKGVKSQTLVMAESEATNQDIGLADLEDCTVKILGPPSAVRMNKLRRCIVISAPVATAIFIDDCENCTFVVACQQLRVHTTNHSVFYLHVTSRAIIEDSSTVGFAPFNLNYDDKERHFKVSGLNMEENNWSLVNDFNWLRKDEHSPNWYLIGESDRTSSWSFL